MAAKAQSSARETKNPAVDSPKEPRRRVISSVHREKIAKMAAEGYTLKDIGNSIGFDVATVKRHVHQMRAAGDLPPSTRAPRIKLPAKKHNTPPRLLPEEIQELRSIITELERKIVSLQTPIRPCPPEWMHVAAEWHRLESVRHSTGGALPHPHRPLGFVESMLAKNHRPQKES